MSQPVTKAKVACKLCNSRRVRCDRSETGAPCSNCQAANAPCELIVSRRGKYKRVFNQRTLNGVATHAVPRDAAPCPQPVRTPSVTSSISPPNPEGSDPSRESGRDVSPSLSEIAVHRDPSSSSERVLYIGDSANYRYVLHEVGDPFRGPGHKQCWIDNLQQYMMDELGAVSQDALKVLRTQDRQHVRDQGAFGYPDKPIRDELIRVFFDYSYLSCPVFHQVDFINSYRDGSLSPVVLNAVFFMAVLHCSDALLETMGFANRYLASLTFYRRAKALYDTDYESDSVATLQALVLLSHRCDGPMEQKDTWHWLGIAAGLAQSLGMHRRKSYSILPPSYQMLWRRIWWVLYINDVHYAAIYGRPPHINPDFCDISPLVEDDFQDYDYGQTNSKDKEITKESKLYIIHFAELASRASRCIIAKYSSISDLEAKKKPYNELLDFQDTLTPEYSTLPSHITLNHGFWPSLIHLYFLEYQIVFCRGLSGHVNKNILVELAGRITRILEDMLASGTLFRSPFHLLPAIFASTVVHIMQTRKEGSHAGVLSMHRVRLTLDILEGFQDSWPHVIYTRHLLECLLRSSTSTQGFGEGEGKQASLPSAQYLDPARVSTAEPDNISSSEQTDEPQIQHLPTITEDLEQYPHHNLQTPVMPMFSFNNLADDIGLSPEFWTLDQVIYGSF